MRQGDLFPRFNRTFFALFQLKPNIESSDGDSTPPVATGEPPLIEVGVKRIGYRRDDDMKNIEMTDKIKHTMIIFLIFASVKPPFFFHNLMPVHGTGGQVSCPDYSKLNFLIFLFSLLLPYPFFPYGTTQLSPSPFFINKF
jgi:hypothetical protein